MDPIVVAILMYLLALLLFVIDVFLPSGGILLFCTGLAGIASVYFGFRSGTNAGLVMLLVIMATVPVMIVVFLKLWPHTPLGKRVMLQPPDYQTSSEHQQLKSFIGTVVVNRWPLIPTGQIQIGHRRFNAQSADGRFIEVNQRVKVVDVRERIMVVQPTLEPASNPNARSVLLVTNDESKNGSVDLRTNLNQPAGYGSSATHPGNLTDSADGGQSLLETPAAKLGLESLTELDLEYTGTDYAGTDSTGKDCEDNQKSREQ